MLSNSFEDDDKVECSFYDTAQFDMWSNYDNPVDFGIKSLGILEKCIDLVVPHENPGNSLIQQIKSIDPDITWDNTHLSAKNIIKNSIMKNWESIQDLEVEHHIYDKHMSRLDLTIDLTTTFKEIKILNAANLEKWDFIIHTGFGKFEIYDE